MNINFNTHIKRGVSIAVIVMFCANFVLNPAWAQADLDRASYDIPVSPPAYGQFAVLDSGTFTIPAHLGDIKYAHKGKSNKIVVHLQDAHCNYFAQRKISDIIDYLNKEYGLSIINLEGGVGKYDLTVFTSISGDTIRREVADYFVKKGEINGAEFYAVNNSDKIQLWGVENKDLYLDNLQVYRDSLKYKPEVDACLKSLTHILNNLKRHIYTPELLKIDMAYGAYKAGNMDFRAYLEFLTLRAKEEGINVREFANLYLLVQAMEQEEKVNFKKANIERNILIDELKNSLSKNEVTELVSKSVDFKTKKISRKVFYDYLLSKAKELGIKIKRFPELTNYIMYVTIYEAVNRFQVMKELDALEKAIKEPLYRNHAERRLNTLSRNLALMKNIFDISLTKTDYEYYLANKSSFDAVNYINFIEKEAPIYKIAARPPPSILRLDDYRKRIAKFYEYSFERDKVFIENLKFHPERENVETAVLMTGGFHTENICDLLKEKDISYVSIIPKFTIEKGYECPYFDLLAGQTTNIQRMLTSILAKASTLQIASMLSTKLAKDVWGAKGVEAFNDDVVMQTIFKEWTNLHPEGCELIVKDGDNVMFELRGGARPDQNPIEVDILFVREVAQDMYIDTQIEDVMVGRKGSYQALDEAYPEARNQAVTWLKNMAVKVSSLGYREASVQLEKVAESLSGVPQLMLLKGVEGFKGHAGGRGIYINSDEIEDENDLIGVIIHEAVASYAHYHIISQMVEQLFLEAGEIKIQNLTKLADKGVMRNTPVWQVDKGQRWKGGRDIASESWQGDKNIDSRVIGVLRQHLDFIYSRNSLMNTFHTMEYWEDVFRKANAKELVTQARPVISELVKAALEKYNSGNWQTGRDLIQPMINKLNTIVKSRVTSVPIQKTITSVGTRGTTQSNEETIEGLRVIVGNIISQKQKTNNVILPFVRIKNGLITGLVYDRRAVRTFEETLTSLGLNSALGEEVASEFENAVNTYPGMIIVDDTKSVNKFLEYLSKRYGVEESVEKFEEEKPSSELEAIIRDIEIRSENSMEIDGIIKNAVEPLLRKMLPRDAGKALFELNERCLIPAGYVIKSSPLGAQDERWIVLYRANKISEIDVEGESIAVLYLKQITKFSDDILRGNPGWSDFKQKYIAIFSESIEQEVDAVILPAIRQGELPFKGIYGSRRFADVQRLAKISLQLLQREFNSKSRQEIVEIIEESIKHHERRHKRNEIARKMEWGDVINGLDEETSAEMGALSVAPYYNLFRLIKLSLSETSYVLPFNIFNVIGRVSGYQFQYNAWDITALADWLVGRKEVTEDKGILFLDRNNMIQIAAKADKTFERDINLADIGPEAVEHSEVNRIIRRAGIDGRLKDIGEVSGKRIVIVEEVDVLARNQKGHAGIEKNVIYIAEKAFDKTLAMHEVRELQKWQEKAMKLSGMDENTKWNTLSSRQRRQLKQNLRKWIREHIEEAQKLADQYHNSANILANADDEEIIIDKILPSLELSSELKNAERIAEEAYEKTKTTGVTGAVPEKYGLNKAMREVDAGERVVFVTAETSSMRYLNNKYGHTAVDSVRDEFGRASFEYIDTHKGDFEDIGADFLTYYNPYGGRWQYVFTIGDRYDKEAFKEFLNALLDAALKAGRREAERQGFEANDVLKVVMSASNPTSSQMDITKTEAYSAVKRKIILNRLYEVRRDKGQIPADIAQWLKMRINSPPGLIIEELGRHKSYFEIASIDEFDKESAVLARDEYYKSLIRDASYQTRDLIVFAENEFDIETLEGENRVFFDNDANRSWILEVKTNGTTTKLFDYFGFPQYIPNYLKIEEELIELKKRIASDPRGNELKLLLQETDDFTAKVLALQYETAYGMPTGLDVINTVTKSFSERLKENARGIVFRINADFDYLSHVSIEKGDVIKMRGSLIVKEEFEKGFEGKGESEVFAVQKGAGDELVVIGYFDGEKRELKSLLENVFFGIENRVKNIKYDYEPLTYEVVINPREKITRAPSVSGGVSFIDSSTDAAKILKEAEFLDAKAEAAVQYSKDTGRARFSFYEDIPEKPSKLHPETLTPILEKDLWDRLFVEEERIPEYQKKYFDFLRKFSADPNFLNLTLHDEKMDGLLFQMSSWFGSNEENWEEDLEVVRKKDGVYLGVGYGGQNLSRICKRNFDRAIIIDKNPYVTEVFMPIRAALVSMAENRAEYLTLLSGVVFTPRELDRFKNETLENIRAEIKKKTAKVDKKTRFKTYDETWDHVKSQLPEEIQSLAKKFWDFYVPKYFFTNKMIMTMEEKDSWLADESNFQGIKEMTENGQILGITGNWLSKDLGMELGKELSNRDLEVSVVYVSNILEWVRKHEKDIQIIEPPIIPMKDELLLIKDRFGKTTVTNYKKKDFFDEAKGMLSVDVDKIPVEDESEGITEFNQEIVTQDLLKEMKNVRQAEEKNVLAVVVIDDEERLKEVEGIGSVDMTGLGNMAERMISSKRNSRIVYVKTLEKAKAEMTKDGRNWNNTFFFVEARIGNKDPNEYKDLKEQAFVVPLNIPERSLCSITPFGFLMFSLKFNDFLIRVQQDSKDLDMESLARIVLLNTGKEVTRENVEQVIGNMLQPIAENLSRYKNPQQLLEKYSGYFTWNLPKIVPANWSEIDSYFSALKRIYSAV